MHYKLFCESRQSCAFIAWHERGQFFFTRACEFYTFIEGVTFSVCFLDALEQAKYLVRYFCMFDDSFNSSLIISASSFQAFLWHFPLMNWLCHRVPSDPWRKPVQWHLKSDQPRVHRIIGWFQLEGPQKITEFQHPCHGQGLLPLNQVAQGPIQAGLAHLGDGAPAASLGGLFQHLISSS